MTNRSICFCSVYVLMEQGFTYFLFEDAEKFNAKADNGIHKTFYKLSDYIEENSPITDLLLENLEALFGLHLAINIVLFIICISCKTFKLLIRFRLLNQLHIHSKKWSLRSSKSSQGDLCWPVCSPCEITRILLSPCYHRTRQSMAKMEPPVTFAFKL